MASLGTDGTAELNEDHAAAATGSGLSTSDSTADDDQQHNEQQPPQPAHDGMRRILEQAKQKGSGTFAEIMMANSLRTNTHKQYKRDFDHFITFLSNNGVPDWTKATDVAQTSALAVKFVESVVLASKKGSTSKLRSISAAAKRAYISAGIPHLNAFEGGKHQLRDFERGLEHARRDAGVKKSHAGA